MKRLNISLICVFFVFVSNVIAADATRLLHEPDIHADKIVFVMEILHKADPNMKHLKKH